jgi:TolB protein
MLSRPRLAALCALWMATTAVAVPALAEGKATVVVTPGSEQLYRAAIQRFADLSPTPAAKRVAVFRDALESALEYSGVFKSLDLKAFLGPEATEALEGGPPVICSDWTQIGADALVEGEIREQGGSLRIAFRVWDTVRCRDLLRRRYSQSAGADPVSIARRVADDIVEAFIGVRGVASTEIAFVSDRGGNKEIFVMNADGSAARAATANRSINQFPSWSPDGDGIIYTSYRSGNRPYLYVTGRGGHRPGRLLGSERRHQYRGVFGPAGGMLALVLSTGGSSDLFTARQNGAGLKRLTNSRSIEVSPSWSPDGKQLAYVSDRTGAPQVYVMNADGSESRRLTFDGSYNTSPSWSPDGQWIAYEARVGSQFDIWLIDPVSGTNVPLITHPRSDEGPAWAPNARKLVFSSQRRGRADLYSIDINGSNLRRLTQGAGDNTSASWGPFKR